MMTKIVMLLLLLLLLMTMIMMTMMMMMMMMMNNMSMNKHEHRFIATVRSYNNGILDDSDIIDNRCMINAKFSVRSLIHKSLDYLS